MALMSFNEKILFYLFNPCTIFSAKKICPHGRALAEIMRKAAKTNEQKK